LFSLVEGIGEKSEPDGTIPEPQADVAEEKRSNQRSAKTSF